MKAGEKRLLRRMVVALALGLACGWIGLAFLTGAPKDAPAGMEVREESTARPVTDGTDAPATAAGKTPVEREVPEIARPLAAASPSSSTPERSPTDATLRAHLLGMGAAGLVELGDVDALLVPRDAARHPRPMEQWRTTKSDAKGRIEVGQLTPGPWIVCFTPQSTSGARYEVELPLGVTDLGDIEFDLPREVHELVVRLDGPGVSPDTRGTLHVWSLDDAATDRWTTFGDHERSAPPTTDAAEASLARELRDLPAGRHALSFQREDLPAAPQFVEFAIPCEPIVLQLGAGGRSLRVIATDTNGTLIPTGTVVLLTDRHARPHVVPIVEGSATLGPDPCPLWRWAVLANSFQPRMGAREDFQVENGELVLRAALDAGHGAIVLARDADTLHQRARGILQAHVLEHLPALRGAAISIGGRTVARSEEDGFALVSLPTRESQIEISADGRSLVHQANLEDGLVLDTHQLVLARLAR